MRRILIDTDTASDDAVAIVMALRHPEFKVEAITTVAGNVPLDIATVNAQISIGMADTYAPKLYAGCSKPLCRPDQLTIAKFEGDDGMGNHNFPIPDVNVEKEHAVNAIAHYVEQYDELEIITLGPLTNIALAIRMYPDIMKKVKKIVAMGAQFGMKNPFTPAAEYNIACDPEAAQIVLTSGIYMEMIPMDASYDDAIFEEEDLNKLRAIGTKQSDFFYDCNTGFIETCQRLYGRPMVLMPDQIAMAYLMDPSIAKVKESSYAQCETARGISYGQFVYDYRAEEFNCTVIPKVYGDKFKKILFAGCK